MLLSRETGEREEVHAPLGWTETTRCGVRLHVQEKCFCSLHSRPEVTRFGQLFIINITQSSYHIQYHCQGGFKSILISVYCCDCQFIYLKIILWSFSVNHLHFWLDDVIFHLFSLFKLHDAYIWQRNAEILSYISDIFISPQSPFLEWRGGGRMTVQIFQKSINVKDLIGRTFCIDL